MPLILLTNLHNLISFNPNALDFELIVLNSITFLYFQHSPKHGCILFLSLVYSNTYGIRSHNQIIEYSLLNNLVRSFINDMSYSCFKLDRWVSRRLFFNYILKYFLECFLLIYLSSMLNLFQVS